MEIERRERDPDTGEMAPSEASLVGEGFGDVIGKIAALEKKLANLLVKKFMINFQQSQAQRAHLQK